MRRLRLMLLASTLVLGALVPLTPAVADPGNTVSITSPVAGSTATGIVTVNVQADAVAPSGADSLVLKVDGVQYGVAHPCAASGGLSCPALLSWDSTGLNGPHVLEADLISGATTTQSAPVTVTAVNPAPTVSLSAPTEGQVVHGSLTVTALGTVDLSQNDSPVSLQLLVDGAKYGLPASCTVVVAMAKTCAATFTVPTAGTSGTHTVQVTMATTVSSAASPVVPYHVFTALKATLRKLAPVRGGKSVGISGQVTAVDGGAGVAGVAVKIRLAPGGRQGALRAHPHRRNRPLLRRGQDLRRHHHRGERRQDQQRRHRLRRHQDRDVRAHRLPAEPHPGPPERRRRHLRRAPAAEQDHGEPAVPQRQEVEDARRPA